MVSTSKTKALKKQKVTKEVAIPATNIVKSKLVGGEAGVHVRDILTPEHLLGLEVKSRDLENAKLLIATEEQALQNLLLSKEILQNNIEKKKVVLTTLSRNYETLKANFTSYKRDIWPEYGLSETSPMGYDPISGLIKKN